MEKPRHSAEDTGWIVQQARALGFDACGIVKPDHFPELERLSEWLRRGYGGEMHYLEDSRRAGLRLAMPEARSAIVCALNYSRDFPLSINRNSSRRPPEEISKGWISRYAWGEDYHEVLWSLLNQLVTRLAERFSEEHIARAYADTGPVSERVLAKHAGLGWIGKNTLLLNRNLGSWFFLGVVLTSLDLQPSLGVHGPPSEDLCGSCRKCIDACPTDAIVEPYVMDARRCISYLTIELRGSIPEEHREAMGTHVFGCDICQDVCPWNRKAPLTTRPEFAPRRVEGTSNGSLFEPDLEWLLGLSEGEYRKAFRGSAIKRAKWPGLIRNACIAAGNTAGKMSPAAADRVIQLLKRHAGASDAVIAESARWALSRIQRTAAAAAEAESAAHRKPVEAREAQDV